MAQSFGKSVNRRSSPKPERNILILNSFQADQQEPGEFDEEVKYVTKREQLNGTVQDKNQLALSGSQQSLPNVKPGSLSDQTSKKINMAKIKIKTVSSIQSRKINTNYKSMIGKVCVELDQKANEQKFVQELEAQCSKFPKERVESLRNENLIDKFDDPLLNATKYIDEVTNYLKIDQLYKKQGSCNFNNFNLWCPVLLHSGQALKKQLKSAHKIDLVNLLQVWDTQGNCVFERNLNDKILNWQIFGDIFLWEEENSNQSQTELFLLKLFQNKEPILIKMIIKQAQTDRMPIEDKDDNQTESSGRNVNENKYLKLCYVDQHVFFIRGNKIYFFEIGQKIDELEAQQTELETIKENQVIIEKSQILIFNTEYGVEVMNFFDIGQDKDVDRGNGVCMVIQTALQSSNKKQLGKKEYETSFVKINVVQDQGKKELKLQTLGYSDKNEAKLKQIKLLIAMDEQKLPFCVAIAIQEDETACFFYQFNEVSRSSIEKDGRVTNVQIGHDSFYLKVNQVTASISKKDQEKIHKRANFQANQLSSTINNYSLGATSKNKNKIQDFKSSGQPFNETESRDVSNDNEDEALAIIRKQQRAYKKFLKEQNHIDNFYPDPKEGFDANPVIFSCAFSWKNKISMSSCKKEYYHNVVDANRKWENYNHSRANNYFNLYKDFLSLQTQFLIAHRNMVSTYNFMRKRWEEVFVFSDWVQQLAIGEMPQEQQNFKEELKDLLEDLQEKPALKDRVGKAIFKNYFVPLKDYLEQKKTGIYDTQSELRPFYFTKDDSLCVNVVVGNNLSKTACLKYYKMMDRIDEVKWVEQLFEQQNKDFADHCIIQSANDKNYNKGLFLLIKDEKPRQIMAKIDTKNWFFNFPTQYSDQKPQVRLVCYNKGCVDLVVEQNIIKEKFGVLDGRESDDLFQIDDSCQICVYSGADSDKKEEDLDREIEKRDVVTQVMLSNNKIGRSILVSLIVEENDLENLVTEEVRTYKIQDQELFIPKIKDQEQDNMQDKLIGCAVAHSEAFGDSRYSLVRIARNSISVYDKDGDFKICYTNFNILAMNCVDETNLYCVIEDQLNPIMSCETLSIEEDLQKEADNVIRQAGLYVFDLTSLIQFQKIEGYKISKSVTGICAKLIVGTNLAKLFYLPDYSTINLVPFFHRNNFNFLGMGVKQDYLIWRETSTMFTALHKSGIMQTWCICTGKMLYFQTKKEYRRYRDYLVYQANPTDKSYLMNFGQQHKSSISLIRKTVPELKHKRLKSSQNLNGKLNYSEDYLPVKQKINSQFLCCCQKTSPDKKLPNYPTKIAETARQNTKKTFDQSNLAGKQSKPKIKFERQCKNELCESDKCIITYQNSEFISDEENIVHKNSKKSDWDPIMNNTLDEDKDQENEIFSDRTDKNDDEKFFSNPQNNVILTQIGVGKAIQIYNFKVLKLKSSLDQKPVLDELTQKLIWKENDQFSELYNFDFPLLDGQNQQLYLSKDSKKLLVINMQTEAIIYKIRKDQGRRFKELAATEMKDSEKVEWIAQTKINQFPSLLQGKTSANFLFSPDFKYMIDFYYGDNQFVISRLKKNVIREQVNPEGKILSKMILKGSHTQYDFKIPQDQFKLDLGFQKQKEDVVQDLIKRVRWIGCEHLEFINERGVSCYIKFKDQVRQVEKKLKLAIKTQDMNSVQKLKVLEQLEEKPAQAYKELKDEFWLYLKQNRQKIIEKMYQTKRQLEENRQAKNFIQEEKFLLTKSYCKIDNFILDSVDFYNHYCLEPKFIPQKNVHSRLIRCSQRQKMQQQHFKRREKWDENYLHHLDKKRILQGGIINSFKNSVETFKEKLIKKNEQKNQVLTKLFCVDYSMNQEEQAEILEQEYFSTQISFTIKDWLVQELFTNNPSAFQIEDINKMQLLQLCFNIFPRGMGILHKFARKTPNEVSLNDAAQSQTQLTLYICSLFDVAKLGLEYDQDEFKKGVPLEIPILENAFGNTVIDFALCTDENKDAAEKDVDMLDQPNLSLASIVFSQIKDYSFLHSGPIIVEAIIQAIKMKVPGIAAYISARYTKSTYIKPVQNQILRQKSLTDLFDYNDCECGVWEQESVLKQKLFKAGLENTSLGRIDQWILGIPSVHTASQQGKDFINALVQLPVKQSPDEIFKERVVQIIIEKHWEIVQWHFLFQTTVPYIVYLGIYWYWSSWSLDRISDRLIQKRDLGQDKLTIGEKDQVLTWLLIVFSLYFIGLQIISIVYNKNQVLRHISRCVIEFVSPAIILINCIRVLAGMFVKTNIKHKDIIYGVITIDDEVIHLEQIVLDSSFWLMQAFVQITIWAKLLKTASVIATMAYFIQMFSASIYAILPFLFLLSFSIFALGSSLFEVSKIYLPNTDQADMPNKLFQVIQNATNVTNMDLANFQSEFQVLPHVVQEKLQQTNRHFGTLKYDSVQNAISQIFQAMIGNYFSDFTQLDFWGWIIFIVSVVFLSILLLNLIIAIISDVYQEKTDFKDMNYYMAKAEIIQEVYATFNIFEKKLDDSNFLFVVSDMTSLRGQDQQNSENVTPMDLQIQKTQQVFNKVDDMSYWLQQQREEEDKKKRLEAASKNRDLFERKKISNIDVEEPNEFQKVMQSLLNINFQTEKLMGKKQYEGLGFIYEDASPVKRPNFWKRENNRKNGLVSEIEEEQNQNSILGGEYSVNQSQQEFSEAFDDQPELITDLKPLKSSFWSTELQRQESKQDAQNLYKTGQ